MKTISFNSETTKYPFLIIYTLVIFTILFTSINPLNAQNFWIGGSPGAEQEWNNSKNWSENKIPDLWDDTVVIPDVTSQSGYFPIIKNKAKPIAHLRIESGANVTILKKGKLIIDGSNTFNYGIFNVGNLVNQGMVSIGNTAMTPFENVKQNISNQGIIAVTDFSHDITYLAAN